MQKNSALCMNTQQGQGYFAEYQMQNVTLYIPQQYLELSNE